MLSFLVFGLPAGCQTEVVLPGSSEKRRTAAGAELMLGNKTIQRWSPKPCTDTATSQCVIWNLFWPPVLWHAWTAHPFGNGGLGEESGEVQRERSRVGALALALARQVLQPFWQVFQEWAEGVPEEPLLL